MIVCVGQPDSRNLPCTRGRIDLSLEQFLGLDVHDPTLEHLYVNHAVLDDRVRKCVAANTALRSIYVVDGAGKLERLSLRS